MRKIRLIALKPFAYATRRMRAGEIFEAPERDARLLLAAKRARQTDEREPAKVPPPPPRLIREAAAVTPQVDVMARLRAEAESLGVRVNRRWGERRLREELAKARQP